jgi:hypothetical protein
MTSPIEARPCWVESKGYCVPRRLSWSWELERLEEGFDVRSQTSPRCARSETTSPSADQDSFESSRENPSATQQLTLTQRAVERLEELPPPRRRYSPKLSEIERDAESLLGVGSAGNVPFASHRATHVDDARRELVFHGVVAASEHLVHTLLPERVTDSCRVARARVEELESVGDE